MQTKRIKIVILRHGRPRLSTLPRLAAGNLSIWIDAYNRAGIAKDPPPIKTADALKTCNVIVTSDLARSIESGKALAPDRPMISEELFREVGLPYGPVAFFRMPPEAWAVFFRVLWSFGYERNGESMAAFKERSGRAAERLISLARMHGSVLFVGHGLINGFIAKELLSSGWEGPRRPGTRYWAYAEYTGSNATDR